MFRIQVRYRNAVTQFALDDPIIKIMGRGQDGSGQGCDCIRDMEWIFKTEEECDREYDRVEPLLMNLDVYSLTKERSQ